MSDQDLEAAVCAYSAEGSTVVITLPRKVVAAYADAIRRRQTGNFVIHLRAGVTMGLTFEQKVSFNDLDRSDTITLG